MISKVLRTSLEKISSYSENELDEINDRDYEDNPPLGEGCRVFAGCCGVVELYGFPSFVNDQAIADFQLWLNPTRATLPAFVVATTIPAQKAAIKLLKAVGFVAVGTSVNRGSGNKVTLWMYQPSAKATL